MVHLRVCFSIKRNNFINAVFIMLSLFLFCIHSLADSVSSSNCRAIITPNTKVTDVLQKIQSLANMISMKSVGKEHLIIQYISEGLDELNVLLKLNKYEIIEQMIPQSKALFPFNQVSYSQGHINPQFLDTYENNEIIIGFLEENVSHQNKVTIISGRLIKIEMILPQDKNYEYKTIPDYLLNLYKVPQIVLQNTVNGAEVESRYNVPSSNRLFIIVQK